MLIISKLDRTWVTGIPSYADTESNYGVQGKVHSDNQGSMMFSNYFENFTLFTGVLRGCHDILHERDFI